MEIQNNKDGMVAVSPDYWEGLDAEFKLNCVIQLNRVHILFRNDEESYRNAVNDMETWILNLCANGKSDWMVYNICKGVYNYGTRI